MAKRDSYEDDDDFLDEEIADWDDDEELDDDNDADESDESSESEEAEDDSADDDFDEREEEVEVEKKPAKRSPRTPRTPRSEPVAELPVEEAPPPPPPVEEEIDYPPDDEKALAALRKLRVRLDVNDKGNVWRAIFDDTNGKDPSLVLLKGLPALKELWLLGTKVTPSAAESFKTDHPKVRVFS